MLECLRSRCKSDQYYTKAGITLVAINPFKEIVGLYDMQTIQHYRNNEAQVCIITGGTGVQFGFLM